jgi:hypothetical protein
MLSHSVPVCENTISDIISLSIGNYRI